MMYSVAALKIPRSRLTDCLVRHNMERTSSWWGTSIDVTRSRSRSLMIAAGESIETVVNEYQLSVEQVRAALAYAAHVAAHVPPAVRQAS
jgi:hypothetical protein